MMTEASDGYLTNVGDNQLYLYKHLWSLVDSVRSEQIHCEKTAKTWSWNSSPVLPKFCASLSKSHPPLCQAACACLLDAVSQHVIPVGVALDRLVYQVRTEKNTLVLPCLTRLLRLPQSPVFSVSASPPHPFVAILMFCFDAEKDQVTEPEVIEGLLQECSLWLNRSPESALIHLEAVFAFAFSYPCFPDVLFRRFASLHRLCVQGFSPFQDSQAAAAEKRLLRLLHGWSKPIQVELLMLEPTWVPHLLTQSVLLLDEKKSILHPLELLVQSMLTEDATHFLSHTRTPELTLLLLNDLLYRAPMDCYPHLVGACDQLLSKSPSWSPSFCCLLFPLLAPFLQFRAATSDLNHSDLQSLVPAVDSLIRKILHHSGRVPSSDEPILSTGSNAEGVVQRSVGLLQRCLDAVPFELINHAEGEKVSSILLFNNDVIFPYGGVKNTESIQKTKHESQGNVFVFQDCVFDIPLQSRNGMRRLLVVMGEDWGTLSTTNRQQKVIGSNCSEVCYPGKDLEPCEGPRDGSSDGPRAHSPVVSTLRRKCEEDFHGSNRFEKYGFLALLTSHEPELAKSTLNRLQPLLAADPPFAVTCNALLIFLAGNPLGLSLGLDVGSLFRAMTFAAKNQVCQGPILSISSSLASRPKLAPLGLQLLHWAFQANPEMWPYLENALWEKSENAYVTEGIPEMHLLKASIVLDLCQNSPSHAAQFVPLISSLLTTSSGVDVAPVACLCLSGVMELIQHKTIDLKGAWAAVFPTLKTDSRVIVRQKLLALGALVHLCYQPNKNSCEFGSWEDQILRFIWANTVHENPDVVSSAFKALSCMHPSWLFVDMLPESLQNLGDKPGQEITSVLDARQTVEGAHYMRILDRLPAEALPAFEEFLVNCLLRKAELPRSLVFMATKGSHVRHHPETNPGGEPESTEHIAKQHAIKGCLDRLLEITKQAVGSSEVSASLERQVVSILRSLVQAHRQHQDPCKGVQMPPFNWLKILPVLSQKFRSAESWCHRLAFVLLPQSPSAKRFVERFVHVEKIRSLETLCVALVEFLPLSLLTVDSKSLSRCVSAVVLQQKQRTSSFISEVLASLGDVLRQREDLIQQKMKDIDSSKLGSAAVGSAAVQSKEEIKAGLECMFGELEDIVLEYAGKHNWAIEEIPTETSKSCLSALVFLCREKRSLLLQPLKSENTVPEKMILPVLIVCTEASRIPTHLCDLIPIARAIVLVDGGLWRQRLYRPIQRLLSSFSSISQPREIRSEFVLSLMSAVTACRKEKVKHPEELLRLLEFLSLCLSSFAGVPSSGLSLASSMAASLQLLLPQESWRPIISKIFSWMLSEISAGALAAHLVPSLPVFRIHAPELLAKRMSWASTVSAFLASAAVLPSQK
ncbi:unnamed protein product [Cyprideis torosa]|uniref:Uncharacterized protein n=1 Tax=Cyprideis torosa TaxID=163714 RepID=A0A7R8ZPJ0_9CRUS|nr:unnamed protein product [Cyprideis torosa]CAG0888485.1 unnamed protein product [Cyprideis torosa]